MTMTFLVATPVPTIDVGIDRRAKVGGLLATLATIALACLLLATLGSTRLTTTRLPLLPRNTLAISVRAWTRWVASWPRTTLTLLLPFARQDIELRRHQGIVRVSAIAHHHCFGVGPTTKTAFPPFARHRL